MIVVRRMEREDIAGVVALQRACFPPPFPDNLLWQPEHLEAHLRRFPEGQFVAIVASKVVGSASACRISEEAWDAHGSWESTLGGFYFENFDAHGTTLYGADISVHPDFRCQGIGRHLYAARFDLVRELRLRRYGTACRIPDYADSGYLSPLEFARAVQDGKAYDRTLSPLLRYGLRLIEVLEDYMEDPESGHAAALLEWRP